MVAIKSLLVLSAVMLLETVSAGQIAANLAFYRIDDSVCSQNGGVQTDEKDVFFPPLTNGQLGVNTCIPHSAWGSVALNFIQPGCVFEEFTDSACTVPAPNRPIGTATGQCIQGLGLDAFFEVIC